MTIGDFDNDDSPGDGEDRPDTYRPLSYHEPKGWGRPSRPVPHPNQRDTRFPGAGRPGAIGGRPGSGAAVAPGSSPVPRPGSAGWVPISRTAAADNSAANGTDDADNRGEGNANPLLPPPSPEDAGVGEVPLAETTATASPADGDSSAGLVTEDDDAEGVAEQAAQAGEQAQADRGLLLNLDDLERAAEILDDPIFGPLEPGIVALMVGEAGIGKSTILIYILVAIAAGVKFAGITPPRPQPVVFFSPEDSATHIGRRIKAACAELRADRELVKRNLKVVTDTEFFTLFEQQEDGPRLSSSGQRVVGAAKNHGARLVVLDPLVELHGASENDNGQMHAVFGKTRGLAREMGCAFLIGHHTTKEKAIARGASSITGTVRFSMTADQLTKTEAEPYTKQGKEQTDLFKLEMSKFSYGRREPGFRIFERVDVKFVGYSAPVLRELKKPR